MNSCPVVGAFIEYAFGDRAAEAGGLRVEARLRTSAGCRGEMLLSRNLPALVACLPPPGLSSRMLAHVEAALGETS